MSREHGIVLDPLSRDGDGAPGLGFLAFPKTMPFGTLNTLLSEAKSAFLGLMEMNFRHLNPAP